jgi:hypothetical protein
LRQAAAVSALPSTLILSLALGHPQLVYGQTGGQTDIPAKVAVLHPPLPAPDLSASAATSETGEDRAVFGLGLDLAERQSAE